MNNLLSILTDNKQVQEFIESFDIHPTPDNNGRFHAPCDGFEYEGKVYGAGEFLHEEGYVQKINYRVKVRLSDVEKIKQLPQFIRAGKSWDQKGEQVCYVYLKVSQKQKDKIDDLNKLPRKELILNEDRNENCGQPFILKIKRKINYKINVLGLEPGMIDADLESQGLNVNWSFDKNGKIQVPMEGKEVCFRYNNDIVNV
jgi:hypothetical protein